MLRTLRFSPTTLTASARTRSEGALAALECRPTVCYCPDGRREALLPPPLPPPPSQGGLRWLPDKFFVTGMVERLWDLYFGPVGLTRWPRPFFAPSDPTAPPTMVEGPLSKSGKSGAVGDLAFAPLTAVLHIFRL